MISSKRRRSNRGLSGAITALILVIASVIIALIVVGYVFGLFGAFTASPNVHIVNAYIQKGVLYLTLYNSGSGNGVITAVLVEVSGQEYSYTASVTVAAGTSTTFNLTLTTTSTFPSLVAGETVSFTIELGNGVSIPGTATVLS